MTILFKIIGGFGILLIATGIMIKLRKSQNVFYILGGVCLEVYSIYIADIIFMILQLIFIVAAVYDLSRLKRGKED